MRILLILLAITALPWMAGCSHTTSPHIHIMIFDAKAGNEEHCLSIWSYSPVESSTIGAVRPGFGEAKLRGEKGQIVLKNGTAISIGDEVVVGSTVVPANTMNLLIEKNGTVQLGSFIRTFE